MRIQSADRKKRWSRARYTTEIPRYGTVENRRGQGGGEHPLFRGGSLHGSAHPNSLHSLDPGGSRWFLAPSRLPDILSKIRYRGWYAFHSCGAVETADKPRVSSPSPFFFQSSFCVFLIRATNPKRKNIILTRINIPKLIFRKTQFKGINS